MNSLIFNFNNVSFKRETTIVLGQYDEVCFEAFLSDGGLVTANESTTSLYKLLPELWIL